MTRIHGFELIEERKIPELNTNGRFFRHVNTGAELLSFENDDENKVFGITFRTPPQDSTGLPHIMEHSVLCGSQKYPVKEPFVELLKGSLKTFLNAFTYPDKTVYPFASQNLQDFYNLLDVYIDAVFHPLIPSHILEQEGWHYDLDNMESALSYKGVVFNEMKGAYSSPDSVHSRYSQQSLFPDTPYGVDSGGDPHEIPNLTYEQFVSFHKTYYHPSNSFVFFYGDDDPEERLRRMNSYFQDFGSVEVNSGITIQHHIDRPRRFTFPYDAGEADYQKSMVTINWLLTDTSDSEKVLGLHILSHILVGTPASPLRKALIDSGYGEDITGVGLEDELRQMYFSTGLKGIALEDVDKVEALIQDTLETLVNEGIDPAMTAAAMNTTEFRLRENNTGSFPRGLLLMLRSLTTWLYAGDPFAPLAFEEPLFKIKNHIVNDEPYFENLISEYLQDNLHKMTVVLKPDPDLRQREAAAEEERLIEVRSAMDDAELRAVVDNTQYLKQIQETPDSPEALATIPRLTLEDVDKEVKRIPIEIDEQYGSRVITHDLFTNDIFYLDVGFNLHILPQDLLPYIPLFGRALTQIGTITEDFVKLSQRIGRTTGGIHANTFTSTVRGEDEGVVWMFLRGKATISQSKELFAVLSDILLGVKLDNRERFLQMVLEEKANQEARLAPGGHGVVNTRLRALFDEAGWVDEQMGGISYLFFLRQLEELVENNWPAVLAQLESIRSVLVNRNAILCNVTVDAANWVQLKPKLGEFLMALPSSTVRTKTWSPNPGASFEGLTIPSQVNFVGKGANLYALGYKIHGSNYPITKYLRTSWLWDRVRVQGGAYGGLCSFNRHSGVFTFLSYRDPNLLDTLGIYDKTGQFLRELDLSQEELTKSIIGAIGDMDAYQLPDAKGYSSTLRYLIGDTDENRQQIRDQILATTLNDFHAFGEVLDQLSDKGNVVVMGSQEAISEANTERDNWLNVLKVL